MISLRQKQQTLLLLSVARHALHATHFTAMLGGRMSLLPVSQQCGPAHGLPSCSARKMLEWTLLRIMCAFPSLHAEVDSSVLQSLRLVKSMSMYHTLFDVYMVNAVPIFFFHAGHPRVPRKERHEKIALPSLYLSEQLSARSVSQLAQLMACCPGNIAYASLPLALSFGVCDFVEAKN